MRSFLIAVLLTTAALARLAPAPTAAKSPVEQENSAKAKEVIDQAIEALGGQTYLSAQDVTQDGRFYSFFHGESNSVGIAYGLVTKYPDKDRFEVIKLRSYHILFWTVGNVPVKDKADIVLIHNANKGYEITYKGTAIEEPKDTATYLRRREHSLAPRSTSMDTRTRRRLVLRRNWRSRRKASATSDDHERAQRVGHAMDR